MGALGPLPTPMSLPGPESWTTLTVEVSHFQATGRRNAVIPDVSFDRKRKRKREALRMDFRLLGSCGFHLFVNKRSQPSRGGKEESLLLAGSKTVLDYLFVL